MKGSNPNHKKMINFPFHLAPYLFNLLHFFHLCLRFLPQPPSFFTLLFYHSHLGDHFCPRLCLKPCSFTLLPGDHLDPRHGQTLPRDSPETEAMHSSSITFHPPPPLSPASFMHILVSLHSCSVSNPLLCPAPPLCLSSHFLASSCSFITEGT